MAVETDRYCIRQIFAALEAGWRPFQRKSQRGLSTTEQHDEDDGGVAARERGDHLLYLRIARGARAGADK
jgi:hypothetical protein